MMNLTGTPGIAVQVGRKASWVATREYTLVPLGDGSFFIMVIDFLARELSLRLLGE